MRTIKINKGWWYGAGAVFGWSKANRELHQFGVGIAMDKLKGADRLKIEVAGETYTLDCCQALSFIQQYRATRVMRGKTLGIVSKSLLEPANPSLL